MSKCLFDKVADLLAWNFKDCFTNIFQWILRKNLRAPFYRTPPGDCLWYLENWINFRNGRNKLKKKNKRQKNSILQENSNIAKIKRNLENCSPYLKPKQQNFRGRYKRVKHIFQSNRETSSNKYTVQQWWTKESYWVFSRQK